MTKRFWFKRMKRNEYCTKLAVCIYSCHGKNSCSVAWAAAFYLSRRNEIAKSYDRVSDHLGISIKRFEGCNGVIGTMSAPFPEIQWLISLIAAPSECWLCRSNVRASAVTIFKSEGSDMVFVIEVDERLNLPIICAISSSQASVAGSRHCEFVIPKRPVIASWIGANRTPIYAIQCQ